MCRSHIAILAQSIASRLGDRFTNALLLPRRTDGSESRHGMRINLSLKRKGSTYMPGSRQPKTCHLIILQFGLMIHVVPAMMFAAISAA
jgi:hypothetical protein